MPFAIIAKKEDVPAKWFVQNVMEQSKKRIGAALALGLSAVAGMLALPNNTVMTHAAATTDVTKVSSQNIAGNYGLGIAIELDPVIAGSYWNSLAYTGISLKNRFNADSTIYTLEDVGQQLAINRGKGVDYYGSILSFAAGATFTTNGTDYVLGNAKSFISKLANGTSGQYWSDFIAPTSLSIAETSKTINVGDTYTVTPNLTTADSSPIISYASSDTTVATISEAGVVTAQKAGTATISVYSGLLQADLALTVVAGKTETGITITNAEKTIHVYQGNDWKLTPLTALINYDDSTSSNLTIDDTMISGTYDKDTIGTYSMTLTYKTFTDSFTLVVEALPETTVAGETPNNQFGTDTWTSFFFFTSTVADRSQYVNLDAACVADVNAYVSFNGTNGVVTGIKNLGGGRYVLYSSVTSLKAGDKIVLKNGLKIYQYSGTANDNHDPNGDGAFYAVAQFKADKTYVYDGASWQVWTADPTDFALSADAAFLAVGQALQLKTTIAPENTYASFTYSSSDPSIATVSATGLVAGVAVGDVVITAKMGSIEHTIALSVIAAKEIKGVVYSDAYEYYSVLKGSDASAFAPSLAKAEYVFADDTTSPEFDISAADYIVGAFDTAAIGDKTVTVTLSKDGKQYTGTIVVRVYETYDQKIEEVAVVDWFIYSTFLEVKNTSTNVANLTESPELANLKSHISYARKDGTDVPIAGVYQLGTNIAVFPSFLYDDKGSAQLTAENYLQYYLAGDRITVTAGMPIYKWTGKLENTGSDNHHMAAGTGELIVEGTIPETVSYRFNGQIWTPYIESTGITVASANVEVKIGKTVLSGASRTPNNATSGVMSFTSSDSSIASVNASTGAITGVKEGQCVVTVTLTDEDTGAIKTTTITVKVVDYLVKLSFDQKLELTQNATLDPTKISGAYYVYASGKKVEITDLSAATITGIDTSKLGEQTGVVTLTKDGSQYTGQITVNVVAAPAQGLGAGPIVGIIAGSLAVVGLGVAAAVLVKKHKKA